jgi:hypothetical protein
MSPEQKSKLLEIVYDSVFDPWVTGENPFKEFMINNKEDLTAHEAGCLITLSIYARSIRDCSFSERVLNLGRLVEATLDPNQPIPALDPSEASTA